MKNLQVLLFIVMTSMLINPALAGESREEKLTRLDAACEVDRQKKLTPMRKKYVADCVSNKELPSLNECERFYADYGERMGGRAPLYYDLPSCVTAFEFHQGTSDPDS